jgi:hypothetical protein
MLTGGPGGTGAMATEKDGVPLSREASQAPTAAGAVFLSYASEDAAAAARIATVLRAAGIEVWFDQSKLRGAMPLMWSSSCAFAASRCDWCERGSGAWRRHRGAARVTRCRRRSGDRGAPR